MGPPSLRPGIVMWPGHAITLQVTWLCGPSSLPHQLSPTPTLACVWGVRDLCGPCRMSQPGLHLYEGGLGTRGPFPLTHTNFIRRYSGQYPAGGVHARYNRRCSRSSKPYAGVLGGILLPWGKGLMREIDHLWKVHYFDIYVTLLNVAYCVGLCNWYPWLTQLFMYSSKFLEKMETIVETPCVGKWLSIIVQSTVFP